MEVVYVCFLLIISIECALILYNLRGSKEKEEKQNPRREVSGVFKDPLGDKYRKNIRGLYRPVKPYRGDEEDV